VFFIKGGDMESYSIKEFVNLIDKKTARKIYKSVEEGLSEINDDIVDGFEKGEEELNIIIQVDEQILIVNVKLTLEEDEISATPHSVNILSMDEWLDYLLQHNDVKIK